MLRKKYKKQLMGHLWLFFILIKQVITVWFIIDSKCFDNKIAADVDEYKWTVITFSDPFYIVILSRFWV